MWSTMPLPVPPSRRRASLAMAPRSAARDWPRSRGRLRYRSRPRDLGQSLAADLGAIARLARRLEGGTGNGIVDHIRIDRLGLGHGVERDADETLRSQQRTACGRV